MTTSHNPPVAHPHPLPDTGEVVRAGVSAAAITGVWTGIQQSIRVRDGEITTPEAVRATANSAAVGAAAGVVAQIASHAARSVPLLGLAALAVGVGAIYFANVSKRQVASNQSDASAGPEEI